MSVKHCTNKTAWNEGHSCITEQDDHLRIAIFMWFVFKVELGESREVM